MIKLNFIAKQKTNNQVIVFGVDLKNISWVKITLSLVFLYVVPDLSSFYFEPKYKEIDDQTKIKNIELRKITKKLRNNKKLQKQIDEFENKKNELIKTKKTIESIMSERRDPFNILYYLAKFLPKDVWFEKIEISNKNVLKINAKSINESKINDYVRVLNKSPYFNNGVTLKMKDNKNVGSGFVEYDITSEILRYNE